MIRTDVSFLRTLRDKRERQKAVLESSVPATADAQKLIKLGKLRRTVAGSIARLTAKLHCSEDAAQGDSGADNRLLLAQDHLKQLAGVRSQVNRMNAMVELGMLSSDEVARHQSLVKRLKSLEEYPTEQRAALRHALEKRTVEEKIEPFEQYSYDEAKGVLILHGPNGKEFHVNDKGRIALILHVIQHSSPEAPISADQAIEIIRPALGKLRLPRSLRKVFMADTLTLFLNPILREVGGRVRTRTSERGNQPRYYIEWHEASVPPKRKFGVRLLDEPFPGAHGELPSPMDLMVKNRKESLSQLTSFATTFETRYDIYELAEDGGEVSGVADEFSHT
jgi:hypothetical protein